MIKLALGQIDIKPGRPDLNTETMLKMIGEAKQAHADIVIFPELAIPGYLLGDTWEQEAFLRDCEYYGRRVVEASDGIAVIFGNVAMDWNRHNNDGRVRKYNACFAAQNGSLVAAKDTPYPFAAKTLHPNYRVFDDSRHFYSLQQVANERNLPLASFLRPITLDLPQGSVRVGCLLCEDGWSENYPIDPPQILAENGPVDLFVNISSSPYTIGKQGKRSRLFSAQAKKYGVPLVYVNNAGVQNNGKTIYTFDGASAVYNAGGHTATQCASFTQELKILDLEPTNAAQVGPAIEEELETPGIYRALSYGISEFMNQLHMDKVVIGASGGIDSAVAAALYAKVLGSENVLLINMPSIYNSHTTKNLAHVLANNLACQYAVFPIQEVVDYTVNQFSVTPIVYMKDGSTHHVAISPFSVENMQARDRSSRILAGIASNFGGGFTCNANKSESTVGYSTLYGDHAGFLAALADLWKHQVYDLARYLNNVVYGCEIIPQATIDIVPSAELSYQQAVDEGKGDPIQYPYHDYLFRAFMERWNKAAPEDLLAWYQAGTLEENIGCAPGLTAKLFPTPHDFIADLERWWNLYSGMGVAKRIQAPPILAVSRRAYGFDHREAQNGPYYTAKYRELKRDLLK